MRRNIDAVDLVKIWLTVVDHITKVISVTKDVFTWIHKHFHLIGDQHLKSNQEDVFLLIKDHGYISKLETLVFVSLQRDSIKLILCSCLIVVDPNFVVSLKDLNHLLLSFQQVLIAWTGSKNVFGKLFVKAFNLCATFTTLLFLDIIFLIDYSYASFKSDLVVEKLGDCIIWFNIITIFITSSSIWGDQRPDDSDNSRTDATLSQELQLQLLNTKHLINFLSLGKTTVVKILVLRFRNLKANSHLMVHAWLLKMHLFDVLFDSKCVQNILIILRLMVLAKLITHDNSTFCRFSLAPLEIIMVQRRSLKIDNSWIKLRVLKNLIKLFRWWTSPHNNNISVHCSVISMKALFQEVVNSIWLTVSE